MILVKFFGSNLFSDGFFGYIVSDSFLVAVFFAVASDAAFAAAAAATLLDLSPDS